MEVSETIKKVKMGKAAGIDGVCGEMLKCGSEIVMEWIWRMCSLPWEMESVPEDWKVRIIVPFYKVKGEEGVCGNHRGICLLSGIVIERVRML